MHSLYTNRGEEEKTEKRREMLPTLETRAHDERVQKLVTALREVGPASHHLALRPTCSECRRRDRHWAALNSNSQQQEQKRGTAADITDVGGRAEKKRIARCLFDGGSQRSFVTKQLSRELNLEVTGEEVTTYPFGGSANVMTEKQRRVRVWLRSQYSRKEDWFEALEIEDVCSNEILLPENAVEKSELADFELADVSVPPARKITREIEILIGADYYFTVVHTEMRSVQGALVALKTDFGWTLQGPIARSASGVSCSTAPVLRTNVCDKEASLSDELRAFWELESLGIASSRCLLGKEEELVREEFNRSLTLIDGYYEASLPWKPRASKQRSYSKRTPW
ncbi:hypothetical protein V5799_024502 [Amblyomma americanum]|uniref:DUF1758 domain-containing protein n=1 Tax=Amblyomma americanum TaxID=6943 RepID=A0AAQ4EC47_AMBAM